MELVDLLDENRIPLGRTAERYAPKAPGEYRAVVHLCLFGTDGRLLIQRRSPLKRMWPDKWDVSAAGGVDTGESSRQAAERECREELGFPLDLGDRRPTLTVNFDGGFDDFFLAERAIDISTLTLQAEEVTDVRWATLEEVKAMQADGSFIDYPAGFLEFLFAMRNRFGF